MVESRLFFSGTEKLDTCCEKSNAFFWFLKKHRKVGLEEALEIVSKDVDSRVWWEEGSCEVLPQPPGQVGLPLAPSAA